MCTLAKGMSDVVICYGPIPMQCFNVAYTTLVLLNSSVTLKTMLVLLCSGKKVGFIDKAVLWPRLAC